jgi:hypothetical protein
MILSEVRLACALGKLPGVAIVRCGNYSFFISAALF